MANVKISQLASAAALTGAEEVPVVQGAATVKTTAQAIADLAGGGLGTLDIITDGDIAGPVPVQYLFYANIPANITGTTNVTIKSFPSISISGSSGYGGTAPFTATIIEFPTLENSSAFSIGSSTTLKTLSAPVLETISGQLTLSSLSALETVSFPELTTVTYSISLGDLPANVSYSFPALTKCDISLNYNARVYNLDNTIFPVLADASFNIYSNDTVSINLPSVTNLRGLGFGNPPITTINLPGIVTSNISYIQFSLNQLTSIVLGTVGVTKKYNGNAYISLQNCSLNQASVDGLLTLFASLDGTNGTTASVNGTAYLNGSPAAPSSVGLAAKSVLQARGWYVATN